MLPIQFGINAQLAEWVGGSVRAAFVSFLVGAFALFIAVLVAARGWPDRAGDAPWWVWTGGLLGAFYVLGSIVTAPKLGAATLVALILAGQAIASLAVDHFGWVGFEEQPDHGSAHRGRPPAGRRRRTRPLARSACLRMGSSSCRAGAAGDGAGAAPPGSPEAASRRAHGNFHAAPRPMWSRCRSPWAAAILATGSVAMAAGRPLGGPPATWSRSPLPGVRTRSRSPRSVQPRRRLRPRRIRPWPRDSRLSAATATPRSTGGAGRGCQPVDRLRCEAVERLNGELEVLFLRVLELRVREPAQALDEQHHRRDPGARDLGGVVQRPAREAMRLPGDLLDRLVREPDQLVVEEDRLDVPDPLELDLDLSSSAKRRQHSLASSSSAASLSASR